MNDLTATRRMALGAIVAASTSLLVACTGADRPGGVDFSGKTIDFVVPFPENTVLHLWANLWAPHLSAALPGGPEVVVRSMPGGGSTVGANWFQEQDRNDGTLIFATFGPTQFSYLLGDSRVRYEFDDWQVVLASGYGGVAYLSPGEAEKMEGLDATGLQGTSFLFGSQDATHPLELVPNLAWKMLGMNVYPLYGIDSRIGGRLMFERGVANIDFQPAGGYLHAVVPLVERGLAVPMMTLGSLDDEGNVVRDPSFPDMPTFKEVCEATPACETEGDAWDAWKAFFVAGSAASWMVFLPAGTDAATVQAYESAFDAVLANPGKDVVMAHPQRTGADAQRARALATRLSDSARAFVVDWLREDYGVSPN